MIRKVILPLLIIGALAVGAFAAVGRLSIVNAAAPARTGGNNVMNGLMFPGGGVGLDNLAEALGISTDELQAAIEKAHNAAIDQALAEGQITQDQAEALRERNGGLPFGGRRGEVFGMNVDHDALLAEALGISTEELSQAHERAFQASLDAAVEEGRLTEEEADQMRGRRTLFGSEAFQNAMHSAFETAVNQAVESGLITQEQADQILAEHPSFGGMRGMRGMGGMGGMHLAPGGFMGDMHGFGRGFQRGTPPAIPDATTTPDASSG